MVQCGIFNFYLEKAISLFTICQKNNCYRSTTLLFGLGWTIATVVISVTANDSIKISF